MSETRNVVGLVGTPFAADVVRAPAWCAALYDRDADGVPTEIAWGSDRVDATRFDVPFASNEDGEREEVLVMDRTVAEVVLRQDVLRQDDAWWRKLVMFCSWSFSEWPLPKASPLARFLRIGNGTAWVVRASSATALRAILRNVLRDEVLRSGHTHTTMPVAAWNLQRAALSAEDDALAIRALGWAGYDVSGIGNELLRDDGGGRAGRLIHLLKAGEVLANTLRPQVQALETQRDDILARGWRLAREAGEVYARLALIHGPSSDEGINARMQALDAFLTAGEWATAAVLAHAYLAERGVTGRSREIIERSLREAIEGQATADAARAARSTT